MDFFEFLNNEFLGTVESVDTTTAIVKIESEEALHGLQVNQLVSIQSTKVGQHLIGMVSKILRKSLLDTHDGSDEQEESYELGYNVIKIVLIGTHYERDGLNENVFRRSLNTTPTVHAECHLIQGEKLKYFMRAVSSISEEDENSSLELGRYSIDDDATAWINANKFFQRHAVIVGSTGSGKSWCVAKLLEQVANLSSADAILFDMHGEYESLTGDGFVHLKVAGPSDSVGNGRLFLPYWLLSYEEMLSLMLERSDANAPNLAMNLRDAVMEGKKQCLEETGHSELAERMTIDSPIPYRIDKLLEKLNYLDSEMVTGKNAPKQGPFFGKLTQFIHRLEAKKNDKRLNFMFSAEDDLLNFDYIENLCGLLMSPAIHAKGGIKIIDFSEVPSDILPLAISLVARLIFSVQQWMPEENRHPIALFCDEAHLYIPAVSTGKVFDSGSRLTFERISKEGRKYGIGLVVISQRPSDVSHTVMSQCNNFIAMRLTNPDDQSVVKRLLPDSMGDYAESLPILDVGEALVVGDACMLPSRIHIEPPTQKPRSATVEFWDEWLKDDISIDIPKAVKAMRQQAKD